MMFLSSTIQSVISSPLYAILQSEYGEIQLKDTFIENQARRANSIEILKTALKSFTENYRNCLSDALFNDDKSIESKRRRILYNLTTKNILKTILNSKLLSECNRMKNEESSLNLNSGLYILIFKIDTVNKNVDYTLDYIHEQVNKYIKMYGRLKAINQLKVLYPELVEYFNLASYYIDKESKEELFNSMNIGWRIRSKLLDFFDSNFSEEIFKDIIQDVNELRDEFEGILPYTIYDHNTHTRVLYPGMYCSECPSGDTFCEKINRDNTVTKLLCSPDSELLEHERKIIYILKSIDPKQHYSIHDVYECPIDKLDSYHLKKLGKDFVCQGNTQVMRIQTWRNAGTRLEEYIQLMFQSHVASYTSFFTYLIDIVIVPLLKTLKFFHANGILHGNISKDTIMIGKSDYRVRLVSYKRCIVGNDDLKKYEEEEEKGIEVLYEIIMRYAGTDEYSKIMKRCKICDRVLVLLGRKETNPDIYLRIIYPENQASPNGNRSRSRSRSSDYNPTNVKPIHYSVRHGPNPILQDTNVSLRNYRKKINDLNEKMKKYQVFWYKQHNIHQNHPFPHTPLYSAVADDSRLGKLDLKTRIPKEIIQKCYLVHFTRPRSLKTILKFQTLCNQLELKSKHYIPNYTNRYMLVTNGVSEKTKRYETVGIYTMIFLKKYTEDIKKKCLETTFTSNDKQVIIPIIIDWSVLEHSPWHYTDTDMFGRVDVRKESNTKYGNQNNMLDIFDNNRLEKVGRQMIKNMTYVEEFDHELLIYTDCIDMRQYVSDENMEFLKNVANSIIEVEPDPEPEPQVQSPLSPISYNYKEPSVYTGYLEYTNGSPEYSAESPE